MLTGIRVGPAAAMFAAALAAASFMALALLRADDAVNGWRSAANVSARTAVPLFLVAYCASSLSRLFGGPFTRTLLINRRSIGLAVAAVMTVHIGAIFAHAHVSRDPHAVHVVDSGGLAYVFIYLMALTSNNGSRRLLGRWWGVLHWLGMQIILVKFFSLLVVRNWPNLGLFSTVMGFAMGAAVLLRLAAFASSLRSGASRRA